MIFFCVGVVCYGDDCVVVIVDLVGCDCYVVCRQWDEDFDYQQSGWCVMFGCFQDF